jgi:hypothetical protein
MISIQEIENSNFKEVYNKNLPDKNSEFFWYHFKESVENLIENLERTTDDEKLKEKLISYQLELKSACNLLNKLQKEEKYTDIDSEIEKYMHTIARNLFLPHANSYYFHIFITNLKRWSKWILNLPDKKFKFEWLQNKVEEDYFMPYFHIKKHITESECNIDIYKNNLLNKIMFHIKKYQTISFIRNQIILSDIYKLIFDEKYFKPSLLTDLSSYFPIKEDLIKIGYLRENLPNHWSFETILKKGRT